MHLASSSSIKAPLTLTAMTFADWFEAGVHPLAVPVLMAGGVIAYVGLYHFFLHSQRASRVDRSFAIACGVMAAHDFVSAATYQAQSAEAFLPWMRAQYATIVLAGYALTYFANEFADITMPRSVKWGFYCMPLLALLGVINPGGCLVRATNEMTTVHTPFISYSYPHLEYGPLYVGSALLLPLVGAYVLWTARVTRRKDGHGARAYPLFFAATSLLIGVLHDYFLSLGVIQSINLAEYSWLGAVVLMSAARGRETISARETRQLLDRTADLYATTLDAISDAVITTDRGGAVVHLNRAAEQLLATKASAAAGQPLASLLELKSMETYSFVTDPVRFAVGRPANPFGELPQLVTRDGSERRVDIGGAPLYGAGGSVEGAVVVIRDLTVQHHAIAGLRDAKRMESIGRLAGGVAHDLNNLLTPILSYVELLQKVAAPESEEALFLGYIQEAGHRAAGVTRQLLALSRRQVLDVQVVSLSELVRQTVPLVRQLVGEDITVALSLDDDAGHVRVDPGQIEQVVLNLASNARDAMPRGGTLRLSVRRVSPDEVLLEAKDTGTGMTPEIAARVFEPFFTTKPRGKGTGLGLASVQGIVEQHGGSVFVDTEPGMGATFAVLLPLASSDQARSSARTLPREDAARGHERVLVVEDERSVRTLVYEALTQLGYRVFVADGLAAAEAIAKSEQLDLLISDVVMPGADGPRVRERVAEYQDIPCLFITGHADDRLGERGFVEKGTEVLRKPFTVTQLAERVRRVLATKPAPTQQAGA